MITKEDEDRPGTIKHDRLDLEVSGQVIKVDEENNRFLMSSIGGAVQLNPTEWTFIPVPLSADQLDVGWYETTDYPIADGAAPWYIDSDGYAHSFFIKDGEAAKVSIPLLGRPDLVANLQPLQK